MRKYLDPYIMYASRYVLVVTFFLSPSCISLTDVLQFTSNLSGSMTLTVYTVKLCVLLLLVVDATGQNVSEV